MDRRQEREQTFELSKELKTDTFARGAEDKEESIAALPSTFKALK